MWFIVWSDRKPANETSTSVTKSAYTGRTYSERLIHRFGADRVAIRRRVIFIYRDLRQRRTIAKNNATGRRDGNQVIILKLGYRARHRLDR